MIKRHVIAPFGTVDGNRANATIPVATIGKVHGIRIGADSDVDVVDLAWSGDLGSVASRIRIAAGAPWIGKLPDGVTEVQVRPVRDARALTSGLGNAWVGGSEERAIELLPRLVLEFLGDNLAGEEERLHPQPRAPGRFVYSFDDFPAATSLQLWVPVMGRKSISVALQWSGDYSIFGIDEVLIGATVRQIGDTTPVASGTGVSEAQWAYEGPSYEWLFIILDSSTGQQDVGVSVVTEDS